MENSIRLNEFRRDLGSLLIESAGARSNSVAKQKNAVLKRNDSEGVCAAHAVVRQTRMCKSKVSQSEQKLKWQKQ